MCGATSGCFYYVSLYDYVYVFLSVLLAGEADVNRRKVSLPKTGAYCPCCSTPPTPSCLHPVAAVAKATVVASELAVAVTSCP